LRAITLLGFLVALGCILAAGWALIAKFTHDAVPGWASTTLPIYFLGGVQLFCAGVLGEYVGKIYMEVKKRPRFLVEKVAEHRANPESDAERPDEMRASNRGQPHANRASSPRPVVSVRTLPGRKAAAGSARRARVRVS
jgi:hypothetical protein